MKATVYKCDGCGREKQQANHWYLIDAQREYVAVYLWSEDRAIGHSQHFCGTECLFKRLAQWAQ